MKQTNLQTFLFWREIKYCIKYTGEKSPYFMAYKAIWVLAVPDT